MCAHSSVRSSTWSASWAASAAMRLWLKDSERRPDPQPARTDSRKALLVGTGLWLGALVVLVAVSGDLFAAGRGWWLWCAVLGVVLGIGCLVWVTLRRR